MAEPPVILKLNPKETLEKHDPKKHLAGYYEVLRVENRKVNLVSRETMAEGLEVLAAESILPLEQISGGRFHSYLDIGSGGGFPAIPIIMLNDVEQAVLLERNSKKSLALERIVKTLGLSERVRIKFSDFEQYVPPGNFDLVTLRLVKLTAKIARKVSSILVPGGHFVYYSFPPEDFSASSLNFVSYCYKGSKGAPEKNFTIFQRK